MKTLWLALAAAGCTGPGQRATPEAADVLESPTRPGPVQTGKPNAPDQEPAFAGQTRAPQPEVRTTWRREEVARGLEHPWAIEPLPDGDFLVTERPGRMRIVSEDGALGRPLTGLPEVDARDQGGLLDVALAPDFATSDRIFWSYAEPRGGGLNGTAVASGTLDAANGAVTDVRVVFRQEPGWASTKHFGSRLVFARDGTLFVTLGERSDPEPRQHAQLLTDHLGTVVRINPDGTVPPDNPFVGRSDAKPEIWSYGHRNIQSAVLDDRGDLWTVEHGPQGGDELNRPEAGRNYGWPVITYGEDYSGSPIGEGVTAQQGMEQPLYYWDPVIGPSGMERYTGGRFGDWTGDLLVGGLVSKGLVRLELEEDRVVTEEWLDLGARIRDVKQARDGSVLVVTDEPDGRILRISPAG